MTNPETVLPKCGGREYCSRMPFCGCGGPEHLPERDAMKPAEQQGIFRKFNITRVDGSDQPGGKHHGCEYFVLDVDHDKHAVAALVAYASAVEATHPALAADMRDRYGLAKLAQQNAADVAEPVGVVYQIRHKFCPQWTECDEKTYRYIESGTTGAEVRRLWLCTNPPTDTALLEAAEAVLYWDNGKPEWEELRAAIKAHKGES